MLGVRGRAIFAGLLLFTLTAVSNLSVFAQGECNLVGTPLVTTGGIGAGDPDQATRLFRDGRGTTCQFNRPQTTSAGTFDFDQHSFTNTEAGPVCVQVDLDATGCGVATNQVSMAAYLGSYNPANILTNVIADPGLSTGQSFTNSMSFTVAPGATYIIVVHNINAGTACASYSFTRYVTNNCKNVQYDTNGDAAAEMAVWRPSASNSLWQSQPVAGGSVTSTNLGSTGDVPVPADYTGDEVTDVANFRGSNGTWYLSASPANNHGAQRWGAAGDIPVQGDYDRDGLTDLAVYRPSTNNFFILRSMSSAFQQVPLGQAGDKPAVADYDGDGKTDVGIYRPSNGLWRWLSSAGSFGSYNDRLWGNSTDTPVPADYDGDGKADQAVFRGAEGRWYIFRSSLTAAQGLEIQFGAAGDIPQPADYDGDRRADVAVFRGGQWWIFGSTAGNIFRQFGQPGDTPTTYPNALQ